MEDSKWNWKIVVNELVCVCVFAEVCIVLIHRRNKRKLALFSVSLLDYREPTTASILPTSSRKKTLFIRF